MSKISLKPASSGSATFTIEAPATNTDRIFELPDEAGKVLTDVSDIEPQVKTATNASGAAPVYACRAWVNFDGFNASIRASGNVSSVTRNGTGDYTVNFATAMPDTNYVGAGSAGSGGNDIVNNNTISVVRNFSVTASRVTSFSTFDVLVDRPETQFIFLR